MMNEFDANERLRKVEMAQSTHEAVCAERYAGIRHDINSITKILKQVGLALIAGMAAILAKLVFHG
jgi:hypothetical protein